MTATGAVTPSTTPQLTQTPTPIGPTMPTGAIATATPTPVGSRYDEQIHKFTDANLTRLRDSDPKCHAETESNADSDAESQGELDANWEQNRNLNSQSDADLQPPSVNRDRNQQGHEDAGVRVRLSNRLAVSDTPGISKLANISRIAFLNPRTLIVFPSHLLPMV